MRRLLLALLTVCFAGWAAAQSPAQSPAQLPAQLPDKAPAKKPATTKPAKKANTGPQWAELNAEQQHILAPLKNDWDNLAPQTRRKWIGIAKRYSGMKPLEQDRIQNRMQRWANLSPEQRDRARENYKRMAKASAEKRRKLREQWAQYQASLPPEQRHGFVPAPAPTAGDAPQPPR
jgi:hypothetical protein